MAQHITISTVLKVGAATAPLNSVTGDATAIRLFVEANGQFSGLRGSSTRVGDIIYELPTADPAAGNVLSAAAPVGGVSVLSWIAAGGAPHNILDGATHPDSVAQGVSVGSLIYGNATPKWDELIISIPAANVRNILGIDNGEVVPSWKAGLDNTAPTTIGVSDVAAPGTSLVFAHRDHLHGSPATYPATAHNFFSITHGDTTGASSPVDGDIIIGNVTPKWSKLAISIPAANVLNVLGVANAELRPSWKSIFDATAPATISLGVASAAGTSLIAAHRDHNHGVTTAYRMRTHRKAASGAQAIATGGFTTLVYDEEDFDPNNNHSTATGVYTAPVAGYYSVVAGTTCLSGVDTGIYLMSIFVNGAERSRGNGFQQQLAAAVFMYLVVADSCVYLAAGDTLDIRGYNGSGGNRNYQVDTTANFFSVHLLST